MGRLPEITPAAFVRLAQRARQRRVAPKIFFENVPFPLDFAGIWRYNVFLHETVFQRLGLASAPPQTDQPQQQRRCNHAQY